MPAQYRLKKLNFFYDPQYNLTFSDKISDLYLFGKTRYSTIVTGNLCAVVLYELCNGQLILVPGVLTGLSKDELSAE